MLYSDKCIVRKSANSVQKWVFYTLEEKWLADSIKPRGKTNEVGLMVWGDFGVVTRGISANFGKQG